MGLLLMAQPEHQARALGTRSGLSGSRVFVGDSDDAHAIHMFNNGELTREFVVDDRHGGGAQKILFDRGERLAGESGQLATGIDLYEDLSRVAKSSGFDPGTASRVKKWTVAEDGPGSARVSSEEALLRTSWENYRQ
ncbi:MAG: hypothetical protein R8J94_04740 [Acidimicrobiia bacterium]|nr:hypothetical protein [Acidimicrobiia bacterium]